MATPARILPAAARSRVSRGDALLVCVYEDDRAFRRFPLEGAMPYAEFEARQESIPRETTVIFY